MDTSYSFKTTERPLKQSIFFTLDIESHTKDSLLVIPLDKVLGEEPIQLLEGCSYSYELPECYSVKNIPKVVKTHIRKPNRGRITTGIYVGRLELEILCNGEKFDTVAFKIRSRKADYRTEYRTMLEDITAECTELLMIHSSPVTQRFTVDHNTDSKTIYQRFSFVKSIIDSTEFQNAVHRITSMPVTSWTNKTEDRDIIRSGRIRGSELRQIASGSNRIQLPTGHSLRSIGIDSLPTRLSTTIKTDTVDTPENRFIKHALKEFKQFCALVISIIEQSGKTPFILEEAKLLNSKLGGYLNHSMFKEVSIPTSLPLNSPVLQMKEGYREVLRVWLMFDLAAKLTWNAMDDDSYQVGKRDVATLYEYWLFFKLLNTVKEIVKIDKKETEKLIVKSNDGLGLQLRAGKFVALEGSFEHKNRSLRVKYSYNRTFTHKEHPKSGSWTQQMRPDYTLSIWPSEFSEDDAEEQEVIVHVHFDAKYRIEGLVYLITDDTDLVLPENFEKLTEDEQAALLDKVNREKVLEKEGNYKRADLLKMHAYKDAIRRTVGAYVLYPGSKTYKKEGFHEVVPGLGAFPVSPSENRTGIEDVKSFIQSVIDHMCNRATRREELSFYNYNINDKSTRSDIEVYQKLPEIYNKKRTAPVMLSTVLVGYVKDDKHMEWILKNKMYNIRVHKNNGIGKYSKELLGAKYLLLHKKGEPETDLMYEIADNSPVLKTREELVKLDYTPSKTENYLIFYIRQLTTSDFENKSWNITNLEGYKGGHQSAYPFTIALHKLLM